MIKALLTVIIVLQTTKCVFHCSCKWQQWCVFVCLRRRSSLLHSRSQNEDKLRAQLSCFFARSLVPASENDASMQTFKCKVRVLLVRAVPTTSVLVLVHVLVRFSFFTFV